MPGFQVIVLGSHGGPVDQYTSAMMIRSAGTPWQRNCLVGVDCGSLVSGVIPILQRQSQLKFENSKQSCQTPSLDQLSVHPETFPTAILKSDDHEQNAFHIINYYLAGICITHEHLDHIAGLVINSTIFSIANPKPVLGLDPCISSLKNHVFNGRIWPNLTNEGLGALNFLQLRRLTENIKTDVGANLKITPFPVSHGLLATDQDSSGFDVYHSTAFAIEDQLTRQVILVWGDVEPDCVSKLPRNCIVWKQAAQWYAQGKLAAIFIECSYPMTRDDFALFGHMNPPHLVEELSVMSSLVLESAPTLATLANLKVYVTHLKTDPHGHHLDIVNELGLLAQSKNLLCTFEAAISGSSLYL